MSTNTMTLDSMMTEILDWACPQNVPDADGWRSAFIESHCVGWTIKYRENADGKWEIDSYEVEDV